jgi:hypothetical protein
MVAVVSKIQSALNFFVSIVLICYGRYLTFELCHIFKAVILYIIVLSCILVTRHEHIISFLCVDYRPTCLK